MKTINNQLFDNFLKSYLREKNSEIELLTQNNSCPCFKIEKNLYSVDFDENLKIFIQWLKKNRLAPKLSLNLGSRKISSSIINLFKSYKNKKKIITTRIDHLEKIPFEIELQRTLIEDKKFPENVDLNLFFDLNNVSEFEKYFIKAYKNKRGDLSLNCVRKKRYTPTDFFKIQKIINFLVEYLYCKVAKNNKKQYYQILEKNNYFLFLPGAPKGCPANKKVYLNLANLEFVFCPNLMKTGFEYGKIVEGKLESNNPELMITTLCSDFKALPLCETCLIADYCPGDCFASQYFFSGDIFTPHPEFCRFSHKKTLFFLKAQENFGINQMNQKRLLCKIKNLYDD